MRGARGATPLRDATVADGGAAAARGRRGHGVARRAPRRPRDRDAPPGVHPVDPQHDHLVPPRVQVHRPILRIARAQGAHGGGTKSPTDGAPARPRHQDVAEARPALAPAVRDQREARVLGEVPQALQRPSGRLRLLVDGERERVRVEHRETHRHHVRYPVRARRCEVGPACLLEERARRRRERGAAASAAPPSGGLRGGGPRRASPLRRPRHPARRGRPDPRGRGRPPPPPGAACRHAPGSAASSGTP